MAQSPHQARGRVSSRRAFLRRVGAVAASSAAFLSPALTARRVLGANERIVMGAIGCGGQGTYDVNRLRETGQVEYAATCDVYEKHRVRCRDLIGPSTTAYRDFRKLLERNDIDAVSIGTPDHWHALVAIVACEAGKDVYCQKPLSLTIAEGRAMVNAARRHNRVFQTGSQQRSSREFRYASELVLNGRIGKLQSIHTSVGRNPICGWEPDTDPPEGLDWDLYLGPARSVPFNTRRFLWNFRWFYDYSGGNLTDWGAHHNDIAQWSMGMDDSGPVEISGTGDFPTSGLFDTPEKYTVNYLYDNGVRLICDSEGNGCRFHGTEGEVYVNRGTLSSNPEDIIREPIGDDEVRLYDSADHYEDFVNCVKSRRRPVSDVETGHRSATVCHLGNISIRLGRAIRWDPKAERIVDDGEANRWLSRPMRAPWHL